jgi:hypothetical protein
VNALQYSQSVKYIDFGLSADHVSVRFQPVSASERPVDNQRLQQLKKQMAKLQHEKGNISNELHALKKKERYRILRRLIYLPFCFTIVWTMVSF